MNCGDMKNLLPAYLDGALSPEEMKAADAHLGGCPRCRNELEALKKVSVLVGGLEEVEPPPFFAKKIMARVKEESKKKGMIERLFFPLHVKLPLEAVATVFIAMLAVFVYKSIEPEYMPQSGTEVRRASETTPAEVKTEKEAPARAAADEATGGLEQRKPASHAKADPRAGKVLERLGKRQVAEITPESKSGGGGEQPSTHGSRLDTEKGRDGVKGGAETGAVKNTPAATAAPSGSGYTPVPYGAERPAEKREEAESTRVFYKSKVAMKAPKSLTVTEGEVPDIQARFETKAPEAPAASPAPPSPAKAEPATKNAKTADKSKDSEVLAEKAQSVGAQSVGATQVKPTVTIQIKDPAAAENNLASVLKSLDARIVNKQKSAAGTVFLVEIRAGKVGMLLERLKNFGDVKKASVIPAEGDDPVVLRIEMLPAR